MLNRETIVFHTFPVLLLLSLCKWTVLIYVISSLEKCLVQSPRPCLASESLPRMPSDVIIEMSTILTLVLLFATTSVKSCIRENIKFLIFTTNRTINPKRLSATYKIYTVLNYLIIYLYFQNHNTTCICFTISTVLSFLTCTFLAHDI